MNEYCFYRIGFLYHYGAWQSITKHPASFRFENLADAIEELERQKIRFSKDGKYFLHGVVVKRTHQHMGEVVYAVEGNLPKNKIPKNQKIWWKEDMLV